MATSEAIIPQLESTAILSCPVSARKSTGEGIEKREWSIGISNFWWRMSGLAFSTAYMTYANTRYGSGSGNGFGIMGFISGAVVGVFLGPFTALLAYAHWHGLEDYRWDVTRRSR
jgi:hypothetical protein